MNSLRFTEAVGETHNSGKIKLLYPKNPNSEFKIFVEAPMLSIPQIIKERSLLLDAEMTSFGKISSLSKKNTPTYQCGPLLCVLANNRSAKLKAIKM